VSAADVSFLNSPNDEGFYFNVTTWDEPSPPGYSVCASVIVSRRQDMCNWNLGRAQVEVDRRVLMLSKEAAATALLDARLKAARLARIEAMGNYIRERRYAV
jgi:hypothetical protein